MTPWTSGTLNPFTFLLMIYTSGVQVRLALKKNSWYIIDLQK